MFDCRFSKAMMLVRPPFPSLPNFFTSSSHSVPPPPKVPAARGKQRSDSAAAARKWQNDRDSVWTHDCLAIVNVRLRNRLDGWESRFRERRCTWKGKLTGFVIILVWIGETLRFCEWSRVVGHPNPAVVGRKSWHNAVLASQTWLVFCLSRTRLLKVCLKRPKLCPAVERRP